MKKLSLLLAALLITAIAPGPLHSARANPRIQKAKSSSTFSFRGALVTLADFNAKQARQLAQEDYNSVVFDLSRNAVGLNKAKKTAGQAGLKVYGWIQVGRDETAARRHPEWLRTPQHSEWLRNTDHGVDKAVDHTIFPNKPIRGKAVVYPWICVNNKAVFAYERERIRQLLASTSGLNGLFLCDIQGPPMGCGCGNILCRSWDNSPGGKVAAAPYQHPDVYFPKVFVEAIQQDFPDLPITPILCEECENGVDIGPASNSDLETACHNIPCGHPCSLDYYPGLIRALAGPRPVGLLAFYRLFHRNVSEYGSEAAWITGILQRYHQISPSQSVFAVLQGWSGSRAQRAIQKQRALEGGATGYIMALTPVIQSWEARPAVH